MINVMYAMPDLHPIMKEGGALISDRSKLARQDLIFAELKTAYQTIFGTLRVETLRGLVSKKPER